VKFGKPSSGSTQGVVMAGLKLYSYFRSSASYRVRIALHWKELQFEYVPVHLVKNGGEQNALEFRRVNPMGHVPALNHDGFLVAESMAILDYLDQMFPAKKLFPSDPQSRAVVLQLCELINSGIQPLQNLKVNVALEKSFGLVTSDVERGNQHWIRSGFENLERLLERTAGTFCFGADFTAADCFLIPQCFSSRRFGVKVEEFPLITRIEAMALQLAAVQRAHPEKQPDYAP
jgi:maleylacetoacetate isomerase